MSEILKVLATFFRKTWLADKSMKENSILGESPLAREGRSFSDKCGFIGFILLLITVASGLAWQCWS